MGKKRKVVHFILNTSVVFEMLKGALYDSNNKKKKQPDIFLKIQTAKV